MKENNFAYIDGANLYLGTHSSGFHLDYKKFRIWLKEKFHVSDAYIFLGNIPKYSNMYNHFISCGFKIIFKEVVYDGEGKAKGNCDADLVLRAVVDFYENKYDKMVLVSSDGDYTSLVSFLQEKESFVGLISPYDQNKCSVLLKRTGAKIFYLADKKSHISK